VTVKSSWWGLWTLAQFPEQTTTHWRGSQG
jgi:hypothetical protein